MAQFQLQQTLTISEMQLIMTKVQLLYFLNFSSSIVKVMLYA